MFGSASATPSGLRSSRTEHPQYQRPKGWAKTNRRSGPSQVAKLTLLKRGLAGTYVSVEPVHLDAYVDEQVFRFNNRKGMDDSGRFSKMLSQVHGRRLTYADLTGKEAGTPVF